MVTVGDVARAALADVAESSAGEVNAVRWVNERIADATNRRLHHRRKVGTIVLPKAITSGLVTAGNGEALVTGDATALSAWLNRDFTGWFLQLGSDQTWFRVQSSSPTGLVLDQPYVGDDIAAITYKLVQRYVVLQQDVMFLSEKMCLERTNTLIAVLSQPQLDQRAPDRRWDNSYPRYFTHFGEVEGHMQLEFYPYSARDEHLTCVYWERPPQLDEGDVLPTAFTTSDLKKGVLADLYAYQSAMAAKEKQLELANRLSNLAARQETIWERAKMMISRRDRGVEDTVLLFNTRNRSNLLLNYSAHTEVALRGMRP